jgi:hypothetical protein
MPRWDIFMVDWRRGDDEAMLGTDGLSRLNKVAPIEPDMEAFKIPFKPVHPAPERMRSPTILAFVQKTISQKNVVTPKLQFSKR